MMSGKSFWVNYKENLKRRGWTYLLCAFSLFLALPVWQAMQLSAMRQRMETDLYYYSYDDPKEVLHNAFLEGITFSGVLLILIAVFAVLLAVQGFSWQNSRRKLDLYMSVPVSSMARFRVIYLNGVWIFASSYLVSLLTALLVGTGMGVASGKTAVCALAAYLSNLVFFLAVYNLTLIAVMMTGKMLVSLLAAAVFFLYEYGIRLLFDALRTIFFRTYCGMSDAAVRVWTSPLFAWTDEGTQYALGYGTYHLTLFLRALGLVAVQAAVYGLLACFLYRKRGAQAAGHAMAFPRSQGVVKLLLMIPFTFVTGLFFRQFSAASTFFTLLGMGIGLLFGHVLIQIIYESDIRSIWKKKWHILAAGAVSAGIFAVFYFDLTGYDAWIPDSDSVREVAFCFENGNYEMHQYENLFSRDMYYQNSGEYIMAHMASDDAATREALRELARRDQEMENGENLVPVVIKYMLENGRCVYRSVLVDTDASADQMDILFADSRFQEARYQVGDPAFEEHAQELEIGYSNGLESEEFFGDARGLIRTFAQELRGCSFHFIQEELPVGILIFRYHIPGEKEDVYYSWRYPVYEAFEDTIGLLREQDAYIELTRDGGYIEPDQVSSITVTCYNQKRQEPDGFGGRRASPYEEDRTMTETFTDPEEIAQILPALYPDSLEEAAGRSLERSKIEDYDVSVVLKPGVHIEGINNRYDPFGVIEDRLPAFVREKIQYRE